MTGGTAQPVRGRSPRPVARARPLGSVRRPPGRHWPAANERHRASRFGARALTVAAILVVVAPAAALVWGWQTDARPYVVMSGSMSPAIEVGDALVVQPADTIAPGDVITFRLDEQVVTHRVAEIGASGYRTKGDANAELDPHVVAPEQVIGRAVARIPGGGYVSIYLQQPTGVASFVLLPWMLRSGWQLADVMAPRSPRPPRGKHGRRHHPQARV